MKLYCGSLLIALLIFTCIPLAAQDTVRDTSAALVKDLISSERVKELKGQTIVVAEFANINVRGDALPKILQEKLTTAFIKSGYFEVVERAQLEKALKELKIDMSGLVDPDTQKQIGKILGASLIAVGSVSEANSKVSVDARIISIQSGKAVSAADAVVGGEITATDAVVGQPTTRPTKDTTPEPSKPTVSILGEGTYLGKRENGGVLGGNTFKAVWQERMAGDKIHSFAAGNLKGDGLSMLATKVLPGGLVRVYIYRWQDGRFKRIWQSSDLRENTSHPLRVVNCRTVPAYISTSNETYRWDGTQYARCEITGNPLDYTLVDGHYVYLSRRGFRLIPFESDSPFEFEVQELGMYPDHADTAGDLDGDGKIEFVMLAGKDEGGPFGVYAKDGTRKAVTEGSYGNSVTVWQTTPNSRPYIAVQRNDIVKDANGKDKPSGGYFYLLQWDGDMYSEIWKSPRLDDRVVDMQVCDPKNEGKLGLVVLSEDSKGSVLTKFVAE